MIVILVVCIALLGALTLAEHKSLDPRVIHGLDATENQFPHQISLQIHVVITYVHLCGGSIISKKWVVTAGHCLGFKGNYRVVAGTINLQNKGQAVAMKRAIVHPDFKGGVNPNDIGLVELVSSLDFNDAVQPIHLPEADADVSSGEVVISGWGSTSTTLHIHQPTILQTATLEVITFEECEKALNKYSDKDNLLERTNVCTGPLNSSTGTCMGDSGGPLIRGDTLVGIVSWGFQPCGTVGTPSVFTKVSSFIDFINKYV